MSRRVIVVGGGIAGLAAAHRLVELEQETLLLEASARLGGTIASERVGDFLVEAGPDSFITEKPWALRLCERLGLISRLVSTRASYQKIDIVHHGRLEPLPEGFFLLAPTRFRPLLQTPLFSFSGKLRIAGEMLLPRGQTGSDESLGSFVRRRLGSEVLRRVAQPLVGGIYAADPDKLSLNATMPRFKEMEAKHRSIILAMIAEQRHRSRARESGSGARWSLFVTLAGGMQELVDIITARIPTSEIRLNTAAAELKRDRGQNEWRVTTEQGEELSADAVILATPAFRAAALLNGIAPQLAEALNQIAYASTATINLGYRKKDFPRVPNSFGFVVPAIERRKITACTFSSLKYPGRAAEADLLLRAFVGGSLQPELFQDDDATMEKNAREELAELLGVTAQPLFSRISRHPNSMPQYHVGHQEKVRRIETAVAELLGLALAGSAYHGVGIADCVRTGEQAAEKLIENFLTL